MNSILIFALELIVLYACGSYAMSRMAAWGFRSLVGRAAFYLLILPGVALHETAHYLACLLTGTRVWRFVPFLPKNLPDGRLTLGYVRHEARSGPITALIALAPVVLNPIGIVVVTVLLTPLTLAEVVGPQPEVFEEHILSSGFLMESPGMAAAWGYLAFSLALGSVPSREDLSSVPVVLVLFALGTLALSFLQDGSQAPLLLALFELSGRAAGIYALPTAVAGAAAFLLALRR